MSLDDMMTLVIVLVCGVLGVIVAMLTKVLYDNGIVVDEFITGSVSLFDSQIFTIIIFLIVGVVIAVLRSR